MAAVIVVCVPSLSTAATSAAAVLVAPTSSAPPPTNDEYRGVTATRIVLFAQSLQVHPTIATVVFAFATGVTAAAAAGEGGPDAAQSLPGRPRMATSLVFLTSYE